MLTPCRPKSILLDNPLDQAVAGGEAAGLLAEDVHGNGGEGGADSDAANDKKAVAHALDGDPVVGVKGHAKGKHVLDKVHGGKGLGGLHAVAVGDVGDDAGGAELDAKVDEAHADDDGNGPGVLVVEGLAPGKEATGCEQQVRHHDGQAELGLKGAAVLARHELDDAVNGGAGDGRGEQGGDKGREVGGADGADGKIVGRRGEDLREGDADEHKPRDARGEQQRGPQDNGRGEHEERLEERAPERDAVPVAAVGHEGLGERQRGLVGAVVGSLGIAGIGSSGVVAVLKCATLLGSTLNLDTVGAAVNVEGTGAVEGRFGHKEERQEGLQDEGTAHGVQADAVRAVLDDSAG